MSRRATRGRWRPLAAILLVLLVAACRWRERDGLYGVRWDSAVLVDWAQSMVRAPRLGLADAARDPASLLVPHDTVLSQFFRVPVGSPPKIFDGAAALALALWMAVAGTSVTAAQLWANVLALAAALALAATAVGAEALRREHGGELTAAALFVLLALNPPLLRQDVSPGWHGWALFLIALAAALARPDWRSASWSRARRWAIGATLAVSLVSVYLVPVVLAGVWALADLAAAGPARRRAVAFWLPLALPPAAAGWFVLQGYGASAAMWGGLWFTPDPGRIWVVATAFLLGTGLLLPAIVLLRREELRRHLPFYLWTVALTLLFALVMNRATPARGVFVERLVVYLMPGSVLAAGAVARRWRLARWALVAAAGLLLAATAARPGLPWRLMTRSPDRVPWEIAFARDANAVLDTVDPGREMPILVATSGHAAIVRSRQQEARSTVLVPAAAYLRAAAAGLGPERTFLRRRAPSLTAPPPRILLVAPSDELRALLRDLPAAWRHETLPSPGTGPKAARLVLLERDPPRGRSRRRGAAGSPGVAR